MRSVRHADSTQVKVEEIYNREFTDEFNAFVLNIRSVARGNTSFSKSWTDWIGAGAISAGVIVFNSIFSMLSAFHVIPAAVSIGVTVTAALAGVIGGIVFSKYRIFKKREAYRDAELFLENEFTPQNIELLRTKLLTELYPAIKDNAPSQINITLKTVMASIANLILNRQVKNFADIVSKDFRVLLSLSATKAPMFAMNTKMIHALIAKMPDMRSQGEVVDRIRDENTVENEMVNLSGMQSSLWVRPMCQRAVTELQFKNEEEFKSLHLR